MKKAPRLLFVLSLALSFGLGCGDREPAKTDLGEAAGAEVEIEIRRQLDEYLEAYLEMFPTRATAAGDHRADRRLGDFSPERLASWAAKNRELRDRLELFLQTPPAEIDLRLDAEAVRHHSARTVFQLETLDRPRQDPLFWSGILGDASVFLLVRDDIPLADRLEALVERVAEIPRFCDQAATLLGEGDPGRISEQKTRAAAAQVNAGAALYESGLERVADALVGPRGEAIRTRLMEVAGPAAEAQRQLASTLERLADKATGDPRLGDLYEESFRLGTGLEEPVAEVLDRAEADLEAARAETAAFCRSIWSEISESALPGDDREVIRSCFRRIAEDRADALEPFVAQYKDLAQEAQDFVSENQIMTPPGPLTLRVDTSPAFLSGQSVGGIYPAGPFAPDADALLFVPAIPDAAPEEQKRAFYGDFNEQFNVMITPHEVIPGHYAQFKVAARGPSRIRAIFTNGVYVEGWGTFSEQLMLDHGWGTPLARVAHLKKKLENIARTIVDIRVHSRGMDRDGMLEFLREDAMQDGQFAVNMWGRAIMSSPQLTTYYLGFRDISTLYKRWRAENPQAPPKDFSDAMMSLGPVPVVHYEALFPG